MSGNCGGWQIINNLLQVSNFAMLNGACGLTLPITMGQLQTYKRLTLSIQQRLDLSDPEQQAQIFLDSDTPNTRLMGQATGKRDVPRQQTAISIDGAELPTALNGGFKWFFKISSTLPIGRNGWQSESIEVMGIGAEGSVLRARGDAAGWSAEPHAEVDAAGLRTGSMTPAKTPPLTFAPDAAVLTPPRRCCRPPAAHLLPGGHQLHPGWQLRRRFRGQSGRPAQRQQRRAGLDRLRHRDGPALLGNPNPAKPEPKRWTPERRVMAIAQASRGAGNEAVRKPVAG